MSNLLSALGLDQLTNDERIVLAEELLNSLPEDRTIPRPTPEQLGDLWSRIQRWQAGEMKFDAWDAVAANLKARLLARR